MLRDITLGQYFPGDSCIHKLDPRCKLLITTILIVIVFCVKSFISYALLAVFLLVAAKLSDISVRYLFKGLKPLWFIIILTFILNALLTTGEHVIVALGFIRLTWEGLRNALFFSLRLIFLVLSTSLLTLTTSPISLTDAMESIFRPLAKIHFPVHELAMMMTIALRFIPTLLDETDKIMKAQSARGADFESGNLLKRAKSMVPLLVPLFVSAFRRADELAMAMEARCYHGGNHRTRLHTLRFGKQDGLALLITLVAMAVVLGSQVLPKLILPLLVH